MANHFAIGDKVITRPATKTGVPLTARTDGKIKYIACNLATQAGGRQCDKKTCVHGVKEFVWVHWHGLTTTISYHYSDLDYDIALAPANVIVTPEKSDDAVAMDDFKQKVIDVIDSKKNKKAKIDQTEDDDWWAKYCGFTGSKFRRGHEIDSVEDRPPIKNNEIDFDVYNGKKKGSLRKGAS